MEILPDDIWLEIFSFLSRTDLLRAALVCRTWNRLSRDSSLWCSLDLQPFARSLGSHVIMRLIATMFAPLGKHLNLGRNLVTTEILQRLFESCRRLESLGLNDCRFHSAGAWNEMRFDQVETLTFLDLRNASGYASAVEDILQKAYNLKYLGLHCCISPRLLIKIFSRKSQLRILDCTHCDWVTDDSIQTIANNCSLLESLSLAKCRNVQGRTLSTLLNKCPRLRTLILQGTQIKDEYMATADWDDRRIVELNVLSCYRLSFSGLSAVLPKLKRLRYLKCALTDEILRLIVDGFPLLEVFFLHRRYPVTVQCVSDLLFHCPSITCLDVSSIPLAFVYFESFLPSMPRLRLLSFAGNELLGTEKIIRSLGRSCLDLEVVCINYFHSTNNFEIERSFVFLLQKCRKLREIILNGLFVNNLVTSIRSLAYYVCDREDISVEENKHFFLPGPRNSLDNATNMRTHTVEPGRNFQLRIR